MACIITDEDLNIVAEVLIRSVSCAVVVLIGACLGGFHNNSNLLKILMFVCTYVTPYCT